MERGESKYDNYVWFECQNCNLDFKDEQDCLTCPRCKSVIIEKQGEKSDD